jgi:hypothetical protein
MHPHFSAQFPTPQLQLRLHSMAARFSDGAIKLAYFYLCLEKRIG